MPDKKKFYLTTPIYYVNARPHIGHAYTTIAADVIARRHRLLGDDTFFLTGTDEHGQKVERSAAAAGISSQQFTDQVSASFRALWDRMGITYDDYIRTTDPRHKHGAQRLFTELYNRGHIYLASYTGAYCVSDEAFVDQPVGTPCPDCGRLLEEVTEENFFFRLSAFQQPLIDLIESGKLAIQPDVRRNEVLSFVKGGLKDLSISRTSVKWGIPVPAEVQQKAGATQPHVIYVWLDALANYMTAIGYGSDSPAEQKKFERYWPADLHLVGKEIIRFHCVYWPAFLLAADLPLPKAITAHGWLLFEESKMSKSRGNIVRTETILDAFGTLKTKPADAPGPELNDEYWKHQQDLFAADVLRYFLLREIPFGRDGSFSFDALVQRYNAGLVNGYGNLVSRTLNMINKYFAGVIPTSPNAENFALPAFAEFQYQIIPNVVIDHVKRYWPAFDYPYAFNNALEIWESLIATLDAYITANVPWKLAADESKRSLLGEILYTSAEAIRIATILIFPITPRAATDVWNQLGLDPAQLTTCNLQPATTWGGLKPGTKLGPLSPIFPRAPKELIQLMTDMEQNNAQNNTQQNTPAKPEPSKLVDEKTTHTSAAPEDSTHPGAAPRTSTLAVENPGSHVGASAATTPELARPAAPHHEAPTSGVFAAAASPTNNLQPGSTASSLAGSEPATDNSPITIDDFIKVDFRVAKILVAERIPKADKLLRLEVDLGYEKRQILSGIAQWYTPEELLGRRIVIVANLAPRKMRGLESHGMLLAASEGENGKPILATFADSDEIALGSRLK